MQFREHSRVKGMHSFMSASKYSWIRYEEDDLRSAFLREIAAARGTALHELAAQAIRLGIKAEGSDTIAQYINDAIGFRMKAEQVLYFSQNCFGTADAISYRQNKLRIHDLKTGVTKASMDQLLVYTAIFCLEYKVKPSDIEIILRIYQNDAIVEHTPVYDEILPIMEKIVHFDPIVDQMREEML